MQIKIVLNGQDATNRDNSENLYVSHIQSRLLELKAAHKELFDKFKDTEVLYRITQNGNTNRSIISLIGHSNVELQDLLQSVYP